MDLFIAVGVLFGMGYGVGYGARALLIQIRRWRFDREREALLAEFDYREDPAWTR
jgi:hypothetical protein